MCVAITVIALPALAREFVDERQGDSTYFDRQTSFVLGPFFHADDSVSSVQKPVLRHSPAAPLVRGIVLVPDVSLAGMNDADVFFDFVKNAVGQPVMAIGFTDLNKPPVLSVARHYVGQKLTEQTMVRVIDSIRAQLRQTPGYGVASAYIPKQNAADGVLYIVVKKTGIDRSDIGHAARAHALFVPVPAVKALPPQPAETAAADDMPEAVSVFDPPEDLIVVDNTMAEVTEPDASAPPDDAQNQALSSFGPEESLNGQADLPSQIPPAPKAEPLPPIEGVILVADDSFVHISDISTVYKFVRSSTGKTVMPVGLEDLDQDAVLPVIEAYVGQELSMPNLDKLVSDVKATIRTTPTPFATIYLPEQDVQDGIIYLVIRHAEVDEIHVSEGDYYPAEQVRGTVRQQVGDTVEAVQLEEDVAWMNLSPNRRVTASFSEGHWPNMTSMELDVQETKPWSLFVSRSNDGSDSLQRQQYAYGGFHNNVFDADHRVFYQFAHSVHGDALNSHNFSYTAPVPWRHFVSFNGAYTRVQSDLLGGAFESKGTYHQWGLDYEIPLYDYAGWSHLDGWGLSDQRMKIGAEYKHSEGNVLFTLFGDPIDTGVNSDVEVINTVLGYTGRLSDPLDGVTDVEGQIYISPGEARGHNNTDSFVAAREGTDPKYAYARLTLDREGPVFVWDAISQDSFVLATALETQLARERLIGSERFVGGNRPGFRGYTSDAFSGDYGFGASLGLKTPLFPFSAWSIDGDMQFGTFTDFGVFRNIDAVDGEEPIDYQSLGLAFDMRVGDVLSSSLSFARDVAAHDNDVRQDVMWRLLASY